MAQSKRDIKHGTAQAKVAGDDEMLRTGFFDGTPLEGGKIADSQPVDLFAAARRVAHADADDAAAPNTQSHQHHKEEQDGGTTTAKNITAAEPANPAATATTEEQAGRRQGMAEPTAGGRRLGLGRPAY